MRKQKGFSLIELLIVVAIILIIAAIAIPNLMRARMSANESSAAAGVRTISTAQVTFFTTYQVGYAPSLTALGTPPGGCPGSGPTSASACLIDSTLSAAVSGGTPKSGYFFATTGDPQGFVASAWPQTFNRSGLRSFCSTEDNVVHVDTAQHTAAIPASTCLTLPALNS
jgi:prepilin-type N-terminal cleavage/methylation domain-containing protein